jgi:hypothetical protein
MKETTKNTLQAIANFATTISAMLALLALGWTIYEGNKRESQEQTRDWQKPIVYSIIRNKGGSTFEEIKGSYIQVATQKGLSRDAIQDPELNRILLSLQETHVIALNAGGRYVPTLTSTMQDQAVAGMMKEMEEQTKYRTARSRIISILESDSGKYTIDSLSRKLKEEGLDVNFEIIANLVTDLRSAGLVRKDDKQYLFGTNDIESGK